MTKNDTSKKKIKEILSPSKIWFHILLAIVITIVIVSIALFGLRIFTHHGQEIDMPDFTGQNSATLIENATTSDFVFVVNDYVFDKKTEEGKVLRQNPEPGEKVKKGRKVYLTIASSTPPVVKMIALTDVSLRQAEIMIKAAGLELGDVIYKASQYDGVVLEQLYKGRAVATGTELHMGDKISLVVGRDVNKMDDGESSEGAE
ncbi:MAG: PASTA domain-containing protein [Bacteroidales bacterium]|nr:PASTA domain-containing protein [Bacteroidales bacterium]